MSDVRGTIVTPVRDVAGIEQIVGIVVSDSGHLSHTHRILWLSSERGAFGCIEEAIDLVFHKQGEVTTDNIDRVLLARKVDGIV